MTKWFMTIACAITFCSSPGAARGDPWEWDPQYGYHREEWYDPGDWFDSDTGIDYERDYYGDYFDRTPFHDRFDDEFEYRYYDGLGYYTDDWYDDRPVFDRWYWYE